MNNLKLTIELVPASAWQNNLRFILKPSMWKKLRRLTIKKYNFKCAICNISGWLQTHEVWEYDDKNHIQKLKNIIPLCRMCHAVKHIGLTGIQASRGALDYERVIKHFMKVNNCNRETFEKHQKSAFKKFEERSRYEWQLDLSILKDLE